MKENKKKNNEEEINRIKDLYRNDERLIRVYNQLIKNIENKYSLEELEYEYMNDIFRLYWEDLGILD